LEHLQVHYLFLKAEVKNLVQVHWLQLKLLVTSLYLEHLQRLVEGHNYHPFSRKVAEPTVEINVNSESESELQNAAPKHYKFDICSV
jgi:hypothetical protein